MEEASVYPTGKELETNFKFANVNYDQVHGWGNVPDNQNVVYAGFAVVIRAEKFLKLVPPRAEDEDIKFMMEHIDVGKPIGSPFLIVDFTNDVAEVRMHEGRGRVMCIAKLYGPSTPVMVHVFPRGGLRARHLTIQQLTNFCKFAQAEKNSKVVVDIATMVYHETKWINTRKETDYAV